MSSLSGKDGPRIRHEAGASQPYETIGVDKLTPIIGAEIDGVDLAKPLSNRPVDEIHRALAENIVIFFRDQHITPQQHIAFGRLFGELHVHPAAPHEPGRACVDEDLCRQEQPARQWGGLAHRRVLRSRAADGQHSLYQAVSAERRRHIVREHVRRL